MTVSRLKNIAPREVEVNAHYLRLGKKFIKTLFVSSYPRYLASGWFSPVVNLAETMSVAIFVHPIDTVLALKNLKKKTAQIEAQIMENEEKGLVRNPILETAFQDAESLRDALQQTRENLFRIAAYITLYADNLKELNQIAAKVVNLLEGHLVYAKPAVFEQLKGLNSILPQGLDQLKIASPFNSSPASSFFPFISADLTADEGTLYGINRHNNTLVIFDRFSLENANLTIFATSGSGKSYFAKLEILRQLMLGTDILVIDPENEYEKLAGAVGGSYFKISLASSHHINPFDLPIVPPDEDPGDVLKSHIVNLAGLLKIMLGKIKPDEEALLDRALTETYASREMVPGKNIGGAAPPVLEDLQTVFQNLKGGEALAQRLYRFTQGSYAGFVNQPTNLDVQNRLTVFSIRDLEEELRPIAMYIIINHIWNLIKNDRRRRMMVVDEAWWLMKYPEGAAFLFGLVKRARKYGLGVTTITQDAEDFLLSPYGRPLITNSSLQLLLKQSPAMIDLVAKTFNLTDGEKNLLLQAPVGQGLFFAGLKHVAIQVVASELEDKIVKSDPLLQSQ